MGQDLCGPWMADTTNENRENTALKDLYVQINARVIVFNSRLNNGVDSPLANSSTQISEGLLKELSLKRSEKEKVTQFS